MDNEIKNKEDNEETLDKQPISDVFLCPECLDKGIEKTFDNEKSLQGHRLRAHRVSSKSKETPLGAPPRKEASPLAETLKDEALDEKAETALLAIKARKLKLQREVEALEERKAQIEYEKDERRRQGFGYRDREEYRQGKFWRDEDDREEELHEYKTRKLKAEIRSLEGSNRPQGNPMVSKLSDEVSSLRQELSDTKEKHRDEIVKDMREEIRSLKDNQNRISNEFGLQAKRIDAGERILLALFSDILPEQNPPPQRKRMGKSGIHERILEIAPEYTED